MVNFPIYLDNNATTRTDPRVVTAMLPYFAEIYGNAASRGHSFGWAAEEAVAQRHARRSPASLGRTRARSSGPRARPSPTTSPSKASWSVTPTRAITWSRSATEHKAVLDAAKHLEATGRRVTYLGVDREGRIDLDALEDALSDRTVLVSVMMGSNEIGTLQPIAEIGALCRARGVLFHTDATQCVGKMPVSVQDLPIDLMSFTAHKMHGPKGVGALYVRRRAPRVRLSAQMDGGGHEQGMRSGTLNVPGIVGFGQAAEICQNELSWEQEHLTRLRDKLIRGILETIDGTTLNGHPTARLPHNASIAFEGVEGDALMTALSEVALSTGSACSSESLEPSYVLRALGMSDARAYSSLRFGVSRFTTDEEIDYVLGRLPDAVARLRRLSATRTPTLAGSIG